MAKQPDILRPLVGLNCLDEPLPEGTEAEMGLLLDRVPTLKAAMELAPVGLDAGPPGSGGPKAPAAEPKNEPRYARQATPPAPAPGMAPRMP